MLLRDRIIDFRRVPASELRPSPRNWRTHPEAQRDALRGVLAEVGIADACLARELPDGSLELIDGHCRTDLMHDQTLPVLVLDVDDAEAAKLLATLDPLASMAAASKDKLDALLRDVSTENESLAAMLSDLARSADAASAIAEPEAPEDFPEADEDLETQYCCPKCSYAWSGKPK